MITLLCFVIGGALGDAFLGELLGQVRQLHPYQVTLFRNTSVPCADEEAALLRLLISKNPTVVIDVRRPGAVAAMRLMRAFVYPRTSSVYVALMSRSAYTEDIHLSQFRSVLQVMIDLAARATRPKCLLAYTRPDSLRNETILHAILDHAWAKKFLDFSIVRRRANTAEILHYNPFTGTYPRESFTSTTKLFPDKLADMSGFELRVPYVNMPPYMVARQLSATEWRYSGTGLMFLDHLARKLNFTWRVVDEEILPRSTYTSHAFSLSQLAMIKYVLDSLQAGRFALMPVPLYSNDFKLSGGGLERGLPFATDTMGFLIRNVALLESEDSDFSSLGHFLASGCTVLLVGAVARLLRFGHEYFGCFAIVGMTLGQTSPQPRRAAERVVFFCVVFVSLTYVSNIFATVTETRVRAHEPRLSSAEDVERSALKPHINARLYSAYFEDADDSRLKAEFTKIAVTNDCVRTLVEGEDNACFTASSQATIFVAGTMQPNRCPRLVFCPFEFLTIAGNLFYERASPYVERFDSIVWDLRRAGLIEHWRKYHESRKIVCPEDINHHLDSYKQRSLIRKLLLILFSGTSIAILVFIVEISLKRRYLRGLFVPLWPAPTTY